MAVLKKQLDVSERQVSAAQADATAAKNRLSELSHVRSHKIKPTYTHFQVPLLMTVFSVIGLTGGLYS